MKRTGGFDPLGTGAPGGISCAQQEQAASRRKTPTMHTRIKPIDARPLSVISSLCDKLLCSGVLGPLVFLYEQSSNWFIVGPDGSTSLCQHRVCATARVQNPDAFDPHDLSGKWVRISPFQAFSSV